MKKKKNMMLNGKWVCVYKTADPYNNIWLKENLSWTFLTVDSLNGSCYQPQSVYAHTYLWSIATRRSERE